MHVHVHQPRGNDLAGCGDDLGTVGTDDVTLHGLDAPIRDQHVRYIVVTLRRGDDASALQQ